MTNFEKIKSMTVEELVDEDVFDCKCCIYRDSEEVCWNGICRSGIRKWLNKEVEE